MSRGLGRCQHRVIELLEKSPERRANREELEEVLVGSEGFDESNVLRAIKSLARRRYVIFEDIEQLQSGMAAPEGQAAANDIPNFATGGATLFICEIDA
jgi:phytoene/squalene synthetase